MILRMVQTIQMNSEEMQKAYTDNVGERILDLILADIRNSYERVREFHEVFGHPVADEPTTIDGGRARLRLALIFEEFIELVEASGFDTTELEELFSKGFTPVGQADIVGIADALGDLDYVVNGAALEHGIDLPKITAEIHRSNMTKLGPEGKPIYREDGKVLKGEGYEPPQLEPLLGL